MSIYKNRYGGLFKAIAAILLCAFLLSDIAWAMPQGRDPSIHATLATESRFNRITDFFNGNRLDFKMRADVLYAAVRLRELILGQGALNEDKVIAIKREINTLNRRFPGGAAKISEDVKLYKELESSGRKYHSVTFEFRREGEEPYPVDLLLFPDYSPQNRLTPAELKELRMIDDEERHLDCPGLEAAWFRKQPFTIDLVDDFGEDTSSIPSGERLRPAAEDASSVPVTEK
ncbi:MAG: hypothetical protein PHI58_02030, partial [Candidatus Omnitrophica bacterium]|nr:hypothetical protein [Candidatus Omnitrophota bacterium]